MIPMQYIYISVYIYIYISVYIYIDRERDVIHVCVDCVVLCGETTHGAVQCSARLRLGGP